MRGIYDGQREVPVSLGNPVSGTEIRSKETDKPVRKRMKVLG